MWTKQRKIGCGCIFLASLLLLFLLLEVVFTFRRTLPNISFIDYHLFHFLQKFCVACLRQIEQFLKSEISLVLAISESLIVSSVALWLAK